MAPIPSLAEVSIFKRLAFLVAFLAVSTVHVTLTLIFGGASLG